MKIGLILPTIGHGAGAEHLDAAAGTAAKLGWSSVFVTDHLMVPAGPEAEEYGWVLEATTALAWVAARHESLRVGFSVIIPAMRDAPLLAKQIATLDHLSGGRLTVGVGASETHDLPEYENLGKAERFARRGAYLDETISLWRHLWSGSKEPFEGEFHTVRDFSFDPLPPQGAELPLWCGGRADRILRRAAVLCNGYHAAQLNAEQVAERIPKLRAFAEEAGRPMPTISVRVRVRLDAGPIEKYSLHGSPERIIPEVVDFARVGVDELVLVFREREPDALVAAMERFDAEVWAPALAAADAGDRADDLSR
jgi:alkanesulfonate monooxygenase SsuD/methylene tetrahydromethanopterin reductase-like flavin-dependent oxidoreductase (luciferase family)